MAAATEELSVEEVRWIMNTKEWIKISINIKISLTLNGDLF